MHKQTRKKTGGPGQRRGRLTRLFAALVLLMLALGPRASLLAPQNVQAQEPTTQPAPTNEPVADPGTTPTASPTADPAVDPAPAGPTVEPTAEPTAEPPAQPTAEPTAEPSPAQPTTEPTAEPPAEPTAEPTTEPPVQPTAEPTAEPPAQPTAEPTAEPPAEPTAEPTVALPAEPTAEPTVALPAEPTAEPTAQPAVPATAGRLPAPSLDPPQAGLAGTDIQIIALDYNNQTPITEFTYLINEDNTGDPHDPNNLPSTTGMASHSPVVGTGDHTTANITLEDGRYLITVRADGYKLGGKHLRLPNDFPLGTGTLVVELIRDPLPLSKIRVHVFHDNQPVNGENDVPVEQGIAGFHVVVEDTVGEITVDWFGNPICTNYEHDANGRILLDGNGNPVIAANPGGYCITDANGDLMVDALPRGKYEVLVVPPDGSDWVQTTTIEGTPVIDAWIQEGNSGYSPREGFQMAGVWVGFVRPMEFPAGAGNGKITGTIKTIEEWTPPEPPAPPLVLTDPVDRPWIALTDIGGTDQQVYLGRGNSDGTFEINGVPDGLYQMAVWDENLDYIIAFYTVQIPEVPCNPTDPILHNPANVDCNDQTVDMDAYNPNGNGVGIPRWFGWFSGHVFLDENRNGLREPGEGGIPEVELLMRFRDGSLRYSAITDNDGFYEFPEVFELEKFYVTEVGFTNLGYTGALFHNPFNGRTTSGGFTYPNYDPNDPSTYEYLDGALTLANLNWAAKRTTVDWGKYVYTEGENGGISGIIQYATTRNEFDAHLQATEDYEPGIPNVTVRLYATNPNYDPTALPGEPNSDVRGLLLNETQSDAWEHPTGCDATDSDGNSIPDPLGLGPNCIETPNISNEVKEGVFDGGYAFETICPNGYPCAANEEIALPTGDYVVEVVPPPGYKIVTEEDLNTADGNALEPALPPSGCVGDRYLMDVPDDYGSPFDAYTNGVLNPNVPPMPLCDRKAVTLRERQNAAADFYLMTDNAVPVPGRIYGFLLDDLNIETDPAKIYYGEKRGVPHTSVGIRDFTGRLITMLETDENGIFEVLLPSTYVADCPTPSGVCPAMYLVVGNDPGDPGNPSPKFNPNYQTITFVFDVWPGKTTYADVAVFPITAFNAFPGSQFGQPAACTLPDDMPQIYHVDRVFYHINNGADPNLVITGSGFGNAQGSGQVTLGDYVLPVETWTDTQIVADLPTVNDVGAGNTPVPGPQQLLVTAGNGKTSRTGLTFHVRGPGYDPPRKFVPDDFATIQAAINAANNGDLIIVKPGTYIDNFTLNKAVKLQGYGPGAPDGLGSGGSVLDQRFILNEVGFEIVNAQTTGNGYNPQIDGFLIMNARDEQDVGGGLYVNTNTAGVEISNNIIRSNGGNFGGGIVLGQAYRGDNNNDNVYIHHNRILNNGGISLAGAVGIFKGADNYELAYNDICGNYSGEYGGGISHFGLSHNGKIHHNRVYFNNAFDEGGGIMIAGELPLTPGAITEGSGAVDISHNIVQANLSNDDGGGIRLLQPWDYPINIVNNIVVNNVSTDFGAGVSIDDASNVTLVNNTIARNANTSTAEDSDRFAHAAGVAVETFSTPFNAYLGTTDGYVDPVMFNNIICENQAYVWDGFNLVQNGTDFNFDLEVFSLDPAKVLHPLNSLLTDPTDAAGQEDFVPHGSNAACGALGNLFASPYETVLDAVTFRMEPNFIDVRMVTVNLPDSGLPHDYHILAGSPAEDGGAAAAGQVSAPCDDIDNEERWTGNAHDIGADELSGTPSGLCSTIVPGAGLSLTPTGQAAQGASGTQVVFNHTLANTGGNPDTFNLAASADLGWTVDVAPVQTTLNPGANVQVGITVTIPAGATDGTVAVIDLTATSQTDPSVSRTVTDTVTVVNLPVVTVPAADIYMSFDRWNSPQVGSLSNVRDEDIIGFDATLQDYVMVFDGSQAGISGTDIDAFLIQPDGSILMSFESPTSQVPGINGLVDDSDIILFQPTSLGAVTAGSFSIFLRGVDLGLTTNGEDIDAISWREGDQLVISTRGSNRVRAIVGDNTSPWVRGRDEDLLMLKLNDAGNPGAGGTWSLFFDGSDIGLSNGGNREDVNGVVVTENAIYMTVRGNFGVGGGAQTGADEDIFVCQNPATGPATSCGGYSLFFDGSLDGGLSGTNGRDLDGIDLP